MQFTTLNAEPDGDEVRVETVNGDEYLVAPVVLVREGVLNGGFLGYDEIKKSVPGWNGEPLTAPPAEGTEAANLAPPDGVSGHPVETNDDGEPAFVSANQMPFIEDMHTGFLANIEADDEIRGLTGETWLNVARAKEVGEQALEAAQRIAEGESLDVSTGYFHRPVRTQGRHDGTQYEVEQKDLLPDHLALLPNERGACSWDDGCGVPRVNTMLDDETDEPTGTANADGPVGRVLSVLGLTDDEAEFETEGCGCGCGGECDANENEDEDDDPAANTSDSTETTETMTDYDIESLAERTAFDAETLDEWDEDRLASLAETVESVEDDGGEDDDADGQNGAANAANGDGVPDEVTDELEALRNEVEALRDERDEQKRERLVETVANSTGYDRETVESLETEALETLADEAEDAQATQANAAPQGVGVNRVPQAGAQSAPSEDETEDYTQSVGALASMDAEDEGGA